MSISSFQEKFLGKGCGNVLVGAFAAVLLFGTFSQCNRFKGDDPAKQAAGGTAVVTVGNVPVSLEGLQKSISDRTTEALGQMAQTGLAGGSLPLQYQSSLAAQELLTQLNAAAIVYLVEKNGIKLTDEAILKAQESKFQQTIDAKTKQYIEQKRLKPNFTPKELDEAIKPETGGKTLAEVRQANETSIKAALADPNSRPNVLASLAPNVLLGELEKKFSPSEAELKANYDTYVTKRILFTQKPSPVQPAADRAAKAQADLKAGKSFESLMDTVSDEIPQPKLKKSEVTSSIGGAVMDSMPEYREMKGKPAGYVSAVVDTPEGKVIYKLISVKNELPKDYNEKKAKYTSDLARQRAAAEVEKQLKEVLSSGTLKWSNNGWKCMFDFAQALRGGPASLDTKMKAVVDEAKKVIATANPAEIQPATLALFAASTTVYNSGTSDKVALRDSRIEVLNQVLKTNPDYDIHLELADLYAQKKDGAKVADSLVAASKSNTNYDVDGQRKFGDIAGKSIKYKADGVISDDQLKLIEAQQAMWRKAKIDFDTAVAEGKKKEEELKKANEAELARQKAEAALQGKTPPAGGTGSTGGSLLGGSTPPAPPTQATPIEPPSGKPGTGTPKK